MSADGLTDTHRMRQQVEEFDPKHLHKALRKVLSSGGRAGIAFFIFWGSIGKVAFREQIATEPFSIQYIAPNR